MALRTILTDGDPALHKACRPVTNFDQRLHDLLDDLKERSDTETILLVAHNGIARAVHSYFYDMTNEEFAAFGMKNCQIRRYDF